jgi:hypothetical protein
MLTDLSPPEIEAFRLQWQQKRFPSEMVAGNAARKAQVHLNRGGSLLITYQRRMSNPGILEAAKRSSDAAAAAVSAAMQ